MYSNKKPNPVVTELFVGAKRLNIYIVVITQPFFCAKRYWTNFYTKKISEQVLQKVVYYHSSDIDFRNFMNLYKKCTTKNHILF